MRIKHDIRHVSDKIVIYSVFMDRSFEPEGGRHSLSPIVPHRMEKGRTALKNLITSKRPTLFRWMAFLKKITFKILSQKRDCCFRFHR